MKFDNIKVGDIVYVANTEWTGEWSKCPVCQGASQVDVYPGGSKLGDNIKAHTVRCEHCSREAAEKPGFVQDTWTHKPFVSRYTVDRIVRSEGYGAKTTELHVNVTSHSWQTLKEDREVYSTEEEAQKAAEVLALKMSECHKKEMVERVVSTCGTISWNIGYHIQRLLTAKQEYEYLLRAEEHANEILQKLRPKKKKKVKHAKTKTI